jgi:hypothetical protein
MPGEHRNVARVTMVGGQTDPFILMKLSREDTMTFPRHNWDRFVVFGFYADVSTGQYAIQ